MSIEELKKVLAKIQLGDNRQVDGLTVREWQDTIGHLEFEDAIAAVTMHRRESTDYLQPAHVIQNVRRVRDARPAQEVEQVVHGAPKPDNFDEMVAAFRSKEPHRIATELGQYNRQLVDAGRRAIPEWPMADAG